jgi:hypothetical protein
MRHNTGSDDPRIIETNQDEDTFVQLSSGSLAVARLVSTRCRESQEQSLPSQDYAVLISNAQGTSFSLCVCDGVGSSYKSNFAARYLAGRLVAWLQKLPELPRRGEKLIRPLHKCLNQWAREAQQALNDFAIAPDAPELVREVLAELRQSHGSETVFFCARINVVAPTPGASTVAVQGVFLWMGNVAAQLFTAADQVIELGEKEDDAPRWSTARGRRGSLSARALALERCQRLIVYTDGLHSISDKLAALDDAELDVEMQQLLAQPVNDDMTVLDIQWLHAGADLDSGPVKEETL